MLWHPLHHERGGHEEESCLGHGGGYLHPCRAEKPHQRYVIIGLRCLRFLFFRFAFLVFLMEFLH